MYEILYTCSKQVFKHVHNYTHVHVHVDYKLELYTLICTAIPVEREEC